MQDEAEKGADGREGSFHFEVSTVEMMVIAEMMVLDNGQHNEQENAGVSGRLTKGRSD